MNITTIEQLWDVAPQELRDHENTMDSQLPSASIQTLQHEHNEMLKDQAHGNGLFNDDNDDNYVPMYYGYGLFCRFMSEAIKAGHELDFNGLEAHAY